MTLKEQTDLLGWKNITTSRQKRNGTVICSGKTKKNIPCKSKTKDISGKCHKHRKD